MARRSIYTALVLATLSLATFASTSNACGWLRHCHRCQSASSANRSAAASQGQGAQQFVSIDATSILMKIIEMSGRGGTSPDTSFLDGKFREINDKLDKLAGLAEQVNRNTEAIESLKIGHEAVANRVSNDFVTKAELAKEIESKLSDVIDRKIDEKLKAEFATFDQKQSSKFSRLITALTGYTHELSEKFKPFKKDTGEERLDTEWDAKSMLQVLEKKEARWKVKQGNAEGWLPPSLVREFTFE